MTPECAVSLPLQVGREEFDAAILRAVAGIEKKRSILVST
jgi:hypothetical protein